MSQDTSVITRLLHIVINRVGPGLFVGHVSIGAEQMLFVHWPYRQSVSAWQVEPTKAVEKLDKICTLLRHGTLESPTIPIGGKSEE